MNKTIKLLLTVCLACGLFFIAGCDKSSPTPAAVATEAEKVTATLKSGTWKIFTVTVDGTQNDSYDNMALTFTNTGYTATNGAPVWPASGTWSFTDNTAKIMKRDDGLLVTIDVITDTGLALSLTWSKTTLGKGRTQSTSGKHVFVFVK